MKHNIWLAVTLAAFICLSGTALGGTILFSDNFTDYDLRSDASPMWVAQSGSWTVTEEGFLGTDCDGGFMAQGAYAGKREWEDYILSFKVKIVSTGSDWRDGAWIGFRYKDGSNAYTLGFYNRATAIHKISNGSGTGDETALAETTTTIKDNEWHEVVIIVLYNKISVILDEETILRVTDDDLNDSPTVFSGGIVLAARKYEGSEGTTQVMFNNVEVKSIWEVDDSMKFTREDAEKMAGDIARANEEIGVLDFIRTKASKLQGEKSVDPKVLAFYYTWYGLPERHGRMVHWGKVDPENHDISESTHYPAIGAYDSHDPEVIDSHIQMAKDHGVDAFICTWWGQGKFDDRAFVTVLEHAAEKDFEVSVYWETAPGEGKVKIARAVDDLVYILEKYGEHPAFLKLDGKPVIFVYGRVMNQVAMNEWPAIITLTRERTGKEFLLVADGYKDGYARMFGGIHTYNICGWVQNKGIDELRELSKQSFASAVGMARKRGKLSCITIIPGYDDTKIRTPGIDAKRQDGETYRVLWEEAIAANPDWVLITSWNEWHEGSEIEPSWEHGDKYIKMTGKYASMFKNANRPESVSPIPPAVSPEKVQMLREIYADKTIGIMPDFAGEAAFWLSDTGVSIKELTWRDMLAPDVFNVKNFPVVVYASGEHYTQSLREKFDVDEAILRYLSEGGLLVAISSHPFPFFYNEADESVSTSSKFGFAISGGWEFPPDDVTLTFESDNAKLKSLPASAPFPGTGDQRWRPSRGDNIAAGDVYMPLVELKDENGEGYGDGIAYIEHKVSSPKNGKSIYVWMRMLDVFDIDDVLFDVFRLAGDSN